MMTAIDSPTSKMVSSGPTFCCGGEDCGNCDCQCHKLGIENQRLRATLNLYGRHLPWCQKLAQMPMEIGRTYTYPTDWQNWVATQLCTCKWDQAQDVIRPAVETEPVQEYEEHCFTCRCPKLNLSKTT